MPTGVASTGTSQASASSTASPKPSRSEGTSTALAALTHSGTRVGVDAAEREQLDVDRARERERAVVALLRARGVGREQQVGPLGVEPQLARAPARAAIGWKRSRSTPHGSTCARRAPRAPGSSCASGAETAASRSIRGSTARVARRVRGWRTSVPCTVSARTRAGTASAGQAVRPKWACTTSNGARPLRARRVAAEPPAQVDGRAGERAGARRELVQLDVELRRGARSAATWSRTKRPRSGWAASGSMFETTSARTIPRP